MVLCVRQHLLVPFSVEENICYLNHLNPLNNERHMKSSSFFYIIASQHFALRLFFLQSLS